MINAKKEQFKKYFGLKEPGKDISVNSIVRQICQMLDNDFIFCTLNESANLMKERNDFDDLFSSNKYLRRILTNHYFLDQSLYIRRLTDEKRNKYESASLIHFLENAKGLGVDDVEIENLKKELKSDEIKKLIGFVDQHIAHADLDAKPVEITIPEIKQCHESIIEVFKKISLKFFDKDLSSFCRVSSLTKEEILKNSNKPFLV